MDSEILNSEYISIDKIDKNLLDSDFKSPQINQEYKNKYFFK